MVKYMTPLHETTMSTGPSASTVDLSSASTWPRSVTSVACTWTDARGCEREMSEASEVRASLRRAAIATDAPSRASALAVAAPMPDDAPMTMATRPASGRAGSKAAATPLVSGVGCEASHPRAYQ